MLGATLDGRYRILRALGQGGMGTVYEAEHVGTGRRVAVKVVNPGVATKADTVARFQREARAAGSIETPHIVQVLDTATDAKSGVLYMVMELLRGEDLRQSLQRLGRISPELSLRVVGQACVGLAKAHEAAVVHRDIKPANIFLCSPASLRSPAGDEITVKVVDFGIAKIKGNVIGLDETGLTRSEGMLGTPRYMSPEQMTSSKKVDCRTDIWSLGVVLYHAMTGEYPHDGDNLGMLILSICSEPARPIQDIAPWVPPQVARLVRRALELRPEDRFQSVNEMLDAIVTLVHGTLSIRADDIVPLTETQRSSIAPRAPLGDQSARVAARAKAAQDSVVPGGAAELSISQAGSAPSRQRRALRTWATALSAVLGVGGVAYRLSNRPPAEPLAAERSEPTIVRPPDTRPAVQVAPMAPPPDERTGSLSIEPADAETWVDEQRRPVHGGVVEIRGEVGSVHRVRLTKDQRETVVEVVIANSGVVPSKVGLSGAKATEQAAPRPTMVVSGKASGPGASQPMRKDPASATSSDKPRADLAPDRDFK